MSITRLTVCAMSASVALSLFAAAQAEAQADTTRRTTSDIRIPVRKDRGTAGSQTSGVTRGESRGDVRLNASARVDSLEMLAASYERRIDSLEAGNTALTSRTAALEATVAALNDSLRMVRGDLATARTELTTIHTELTATTARTAAIADSLQRLNQRWLHFKNGSLFGNSGFYVGLGTGQDYTTGTLRDLRYSPGLNITIPIGWSKRGSMIGIRTEWGMQRIEGRVQGPFVNPDPKVYSGIGMLTVNLPINAAKSNLIYLMAGGGIYQFHNVGTRSSLAQLFNNVDETPKTETQFGWTGGAGVELHILGPTSLFVQSRFTNVNADNGIVGGNDVGKSLRWIPVVVGFQLR